MRAVTLLLPVGLVLHFCQGRPQTGKDAQSSQQEQHVHASEGYKFKFAVSSGPTHSPLGEIKPRGIDEDISKSGLTPQVRSEHLNHDLAYGGTDSNGANITTTQFSLEPAKQKLSNEDTDDRIGTNLLITLTGTG